MSHQTAPIVEQWQRDAATLPIKWRIDAQGGDAAAWGEAVGWDVTEVLAEPQRLENF
jgi:hypothetical protein